MTNDGIRPVTEDERALMTHVSMFGSDGYPVRKLGRKWIWGPWRSVNGPPTVFRTKREATESFERFLDVLRDALGEHARALHESDQERRALALLAMSAALARGDRPS